MQQFLEREKWKGHIDRHIEELDDYKANRCPNPRPKCVDAFQSVLGLKFHLQDVALLGVAYDQYDVDAFRSTLRLLLTHLSYFRGLVPPQHLIEFAQDSMSTETGMGKSSDCPKDISVPP